MALFFFFFIFMERNGSRPVKLDTGASYSLTLLQQPRIPTDHTSHIKIVTQAPHKHIHPWRNRQEANDCIFYTSHFPPYKKNSPRQNIKRSGTLPSRNTQPCIKYPSDPNSSSHIYPTVHYNQSK